MGISRFRRMLALSTLLAAVPARAAPPAADRIGTIRAVPTWNATPSTVVRAQQRTFESGTASLAGTLFAPESEGRIPAVIALHAASSPKRDNPLYAHLIEILAPLKVAVFLFDRRGSGGSGGRLEDSDYATLADDGIAAQRMLAADRRIDPGRIGFWGLSQGGWLSLLAASRSPQAAFAVAVSAPMVTPDVQMNFAVANILRIKGYSQRDIEQAIAARTAVDDFQRGKRDRVSAQKILDAATTKPWFEHIYMARTFNDPDRSQWARELRHDPLAVLEAVEQPALLIYGSADPWIPVQVSIDRLRASSARHPSIRTTVIAGADHAMATSVPVADQVEPALLARHAPQSAEYFGVLVAWLTGQGIASPP